MINDYQHKRLWSTTPTAPQRVSAQPSYGEAVEYHLRRAGASSRLAAQLVNSNMSYLRNAAVDRRPAADVARILYSSHQNFINHK